MKFGKKIPKKRVFLKPNWRKTEKKSHGKPFSRIFFSHFFDKSNTPQYNLWTMQQRFDQLGYFLKHRYTTPSLKKNKNSNIIYFFWYWAWYKRRNLAYIAHLAQVHVGQFVPTLGPIMAKWMRKRASAVRFYVFCCPNFELYEPILERECVEYKIICN